MFVPFLFISFFLLGAPSAFASGAPEDCPDRVILPVPGPEPCDTLQIPEILALEAFRDQALELRNEPISSEERDALLLSLRVLGRGAYSAITVIFDDQTQEADKNRESSTDEVNRELAARLQEIEKDFEAQKAEIEISLARARRLLDQNYKETTEKLKQEARKELDQCNTSRCKQKVQALLRRQLAAAKNSYRRDIRRANARHRAQLREATEKYQKLLEAAYIYFDLEVEYIEALYERALRLARDQHQSRAKYILGLGNESSALIYQRPLQS